MSRYPEKVFVFCVCLTTLFVVQICHAQSGTKESSTVIEDVMKPRTPAATPAVDHSTAGATLYSAAGNCDCVQCQSGCGPDCAGGCHECVPSRKSKWAKLKDCLYQKKKPVTGFCVEEVQYGANAGYPSYGVVSHGPWWNGVPYGPGHGKVAQIKASIAQRQSARQMAHEARCRSRSHQSRNAGCASCGVAPCEGGCQNGDCMPPSMGDYIMDAPTESMSSYPLYSGAPAVTPSAVPTAKDSEKQGK